LRLLYLDEAGISAHEPALCVAGVMVHGDHQALGVEQKLDELIAKYIPEKDRGGFVFHATDIFHGSGYFDRQKWSRESRLQILTDLAGIIEQFHLPVILSAYQKDGFGAGVPEVVDAAHAQKRFVMQTASLADCAVWADRWLEKYAADENAIIIAEDTDRVKKMLKIAIRLFRNPAMLKAAGLELPGLPLKRIVDTVLFAAKEDCAALQLADLCAFTFGRAFKDKTIPMQVFGILYNHCKWIQSFKPDVKLPELSEITETLP
jgi:hypothetical protein